MTITIELALIVYLICLREDKLGYDMFPDEAEYDIYLIAREHAFTHKNYEFALHLNDSKERSRWLKRNNDERLMLIWEALGWVEVGYHSPSWSSKKRYIIPRRYRSYPPGEIREMDEFETAQRLEEARENLNRGNRITLSSGCSRETAWRLYEAGMVSHNPPLHPNMVLKEEYRR